MDSKCQSQFLADRISNVSKGSDIQTDCRVKTYVPMVMCEEWL